MRVLVTGGNQGIGYALCQQLVLKHNCDVILSARNPQKGKEAVSKINDAIGTGGTSSSCTGTVTFLELDTSDDASVVAAAASLVDTNTNLQAIINNAGIGLNTGQSGDILSTNLFGPKRVCDNFIPLLEASDERSSGGRRIAPHIINIGSGSGPNYVSSVRSQHDKAMLCGGPESTCTWADIEDHANNNISSGRDVYGLSKSLVACYTGLLARTYSPKLLVSCVTPGFIETQMTSGWGASKSAQEGTVPILKCLFGGDDDDKTQYYGSGWYYGSDGIRSPYHFMRNPGEPEYDGINPFL